MAPDASGSGSSTSGGGSRAAAKMRTRSSRMPRLVISVALFLATAGTLGSWWIWSGVHVRTNNAYVVGNITPVSSELSGKVVALYTDDHMMVNAGDALAQIDPVPWQIAVDQALADLGQVRA
jgi:membrane fusion protein, multidrug efflux system